MNRQSIAGLDDLPQYPSWLEVAKTYAKCHRAMSERLAPLDLSVAQHEVLVAIGREPGQSQKALAWRLLVAKSNVTGMLQRMEARGLVRREQDESDARGRRIYLTPVGRRLLAKSVKAHAGIVELMTRDLSARQVDELGTIMRTVGSSLDEALAGDA